MAQAANYFAWQGRLVTPRLGRRVIEVGCGIGNLHRYVARPGGRGRCGCRSRVYRTAACAICLAVDCIRSFASRTARELGSGALSPGLRVPNVLEHIEDDVRAMAAMASVLAPDGAVVLLAPAFQSLYGPIDRNLAHYRR